jgi:hypothetical protein
LYLVLGDCFSNLLTGVNACKKGRRFRALHYSELSSGSGSSDDEVAIAAITCAMGSISSCGAAAVVLHFPKKVRKGVLFSKRLFLLYKK